MMIAALLLAAQAAIAQPSDGSAPGAARAPGEPHFEHVLVVSIDGLRPDAIDPNPAGRTPALARMLRGPGTMNARTDPDVTVTLPNHISMVTGLAMAGEAGHTWALNSDQFFMQGHGTLHAKAGRYVPTMFDVAHDRGVATGIFAGKLKFWLFMLSYDGTAGAKDLVPPDDGQRKIDAFAYADTSLDISAQLVTWLEGRSGRSLCLVHFADPDKAGHDKGWIVEPGSAYLAGVSRADAALGAIMTAIDGSARLRGRTAIILTTDHGGGDPLLSHTAVRSACNFRIPFLVWLGRDGPVVDLAQLNADRRAQPAAGRQIEHDEPLQPIRNGDAANLALQLLGLPAVPGSTCNARQDLQVRAPAAVAP